MSRRPPHTLTFTRNMSSVHSIPSTAIVSIPSFVHPFQISGHHPQGLSIRYIAILVMIGNKSQDKSKRSAFLVAALHANFRSETVYAQGVVLARVADDANQSIVSHIPTRSKSPTDHHPSLPYLRSFTLPATAISSSSSSTAYSVHVLTGEEVHNTLIITKGSPCFDIAHSDLLHSTLPES